MPSSARRQAWLEMQGWSGIKPKGVLRFNQYDHVIHAAIAGQGILATVTFRVLAEGTGTRLEDH